MAARKAAVAAAGVLAVLYGIHRWRSNARLDPKGRIVVVTGYAYPSSACPPAQCDIRR